MSNTVKAKTYRDTVMSWPPPPPGIELRGRVVHAMVRHDLWCRTLNGGTPNECNCHPIVTLHLMPLAPTWDAAGD
jgi:hypothetical protein